MGRKRRRFSKEFKAETVALLRTSEKIVARSQQISGSVNLFFDAGLIKPTSMSATAALKN